ncbi:ABC transporter substrate-binding protein [Chloroflexota bacterium]
MNIRSRTWYLPITLLMIVAMLVLAGCGATEAPAPEPTSAPEPEAPEATEAPAPEPTEPPAAEEASQFVYLGYVIAETLDDHVRGDNPTGLPSEGIYESLIDYKSGTMDLEPKLATDWSVSDDGLIYTFNLRDGVTFHDGTTFDAEDVKASYDRGMAIGTGVAFALSPIKEVRAADPMTVEIELNEPFAPFLGPLPIVAIYSAEAIAEHASEGELGTEWFIDHAVGTGPYKLDDFKRGEEIVLTKFDDYWGGWDGKHVDEYIFRLVAEGATQRMMVEAGEGHMADKIPTEDIEQMGSNPEIEVIEPLNTIRQFYLKLNTVGGPTQDKAVRQAINLAFDRQTFCQDLMQGHCAEPVSLLPAVLPDQDPSITPPEIDLEKAAEVLQAAGWTDTDGDGIRDKDGEPLALQMMYLGPYEWQRMGGELLQSSLAEIGVQLELEGQPWSTMVERMNDATVRPEITFVAVYPTSPSADTAFWPMFHTDSGHWSNFNYSDPHVDEQLELARQSVDEEARRQIYYDLDRYLMDEAPAIAAVTMPMTFVTSDRVQGFVFQPMDPFIPPLYEMYLEE